MSRPPEFLPLSDAAARAVAGPGSRHAALIEDAFKVLVETPGGGVSVDGDARARGLAKRAIAALAAQADAGAVADQNAVAHEPPAQTRRVGHRHQQEVRVRGRERVAALGELGAEIGALLEHQPPRLLGVVVVLERGARVSRDTFQLDLDTLWRPNRASYGFHDLHSRGRHIAPWISAAGWSATARTRRTMVPAMMTTAAPRGIADSHSASSCDASCATRKSGSQLGTEYATRCAMARGTTMSIASSPQAAGAITRKPSRHAVRRVITTPAVISPSVMTP